MKKLSLRSVQPLIAKASRALGAGQRLSFTAQGQRGELHLLPCLQQSVPQATGVWLNSAVGPLGLDDAEALLSLLGELPLTLGSTEQDWYWQVFNQQLSPDIAELLAPIESFHGEPPVSSLACRIQLRLGQQRIYASLQCAPETLLRLLQAAPWQALQRSLEDSWQVPSALILGELSLTLQQLASLRPGDVLLPSTCHFDSQGHGQLKLAGRNWTAQTQNSGQQMYLQLGHEEYCAHEH